MYASRGRMLEEDMTLDEEDEELLDSKPKEISLKIEEEQEEQHCETQNQNCMSPNLLEYPFVSQLQ